MSDLREMLDKLSAAEEFFDFFAIPYDQSVVNVNRLHILKRFHDYLRRESDLEELDDSALRARYRTLLERAYQDFVASNAVTEKVFKVFHQVRGIAHIPLEKLSCSVRQEEGAAGK
ncbi:MAG: nitrogenase stabilizing/protective protein NifW [Pseudomonadota bacterium]